MYAIRSYYEFRFAETESAIARADLAAGNEAGKTVVVWVAREIAVGSRKNQRYRRVES